MMNSNAIEGLRRFLKHAEALKPQNNPRRENGFAREFQEIKELTSRLKKDPSYSTKHGEKDFNRPKNRYKDILPYDYSRIILPAIQGVDGSDYINGNYIKGPTDEILYLAAQGPLPQSVNDFWRMIISHQTQVIVMACREYELGKLKCKRYWPENRDEKLTFNGFEVSLISQEELGDGFIIRTLCAKHSKGELKVTQFHYTAWPDHDVPRSATPLIELTMSFRAFVGTDNNVPVLVHCSAGCGRTGTICALDYALSLLRLKRTENFSVFDIVSNLRKQRIAMVQTKEQYELVYKAVKEIVSNELLKQRASVHTYVNVAVGEELPEPSEQMYENVDFIRSIQRLHEEEKNASRKPRELPASPQKAIVVTPKKDLALLPEKKSPKPNRADAAANQRPPQPLPNQRQDHILPNHNQESPRKVSKENIMQSSTKPEIKQKPMSGYENVLPLSAQKNLNKPALPTTPKPQNYVNVVLGSSTKEDPCNDYVNVPSSTAKAMPHPEIKSEPGDRPTKPVPVPSIAKPSVQIKSVAQNVNSEKEDDYVIPPIPRKSEKSGIFPLSSASSENIKQIPEGNLIDLSESDSNLLPLRRSSSEFEVQSNKTKLLKQRPLDSILPADLSRSSPSISTRDSNTTQPQLNKPSQEKKQAKTQQRMSGQYSLVGAIDGSRSPNDHDSGDPFENVPKVHAEKQQVIPKKQPEIPQKIPKPKDRSSFGVIESVFADSGLEKPHAPPRRKSEGSPEKYSDQLSSKQKPVTGIYSVVGIPSKEQSKKDELLVDFADKSGEDYPRVGPSDPKPVQKASSTENVYNKKLDLNTSNGQPKTVVKKQNSLDSNCSNYFDSVPPTRIKSEDPLGSGPASSLYSTVGSYMPPKKVSSEKVETAVVGSSATKGSRPKFPVRRSNSGVTPSSSQLANVDNAESVYATVGPKTKDKRRTPLKPEMWCPRENSPPSSLERELRRSDHSSSSIRSINSTSSNDSLDDAPPIPTKTSDAFCCPDDEDAYEAVQKSTATRTTLDRFKSKAKNMMATGATVTKLSIGKKASSLPHISSSDSLASGEGLDFDTSSFGKRVDKPVGSRPCPSHWPQFPR